MDRGALAEWFPLATKFPVTLAKDVAPESLADGQTPDSYGIGIDKPGYLYADTPSSGTVWNGIGTTSAPTYAPAVCTWRFCFNRLWGYTGNTLYYGAYGYDSTYILQGLGSIPVDYESSNITNVIPFGSNVAVLKSDNLYIIRNADNTEGGFTAEYVKQASGLPVALDAIAVDNTLVWANTHGIFATDGQGINELTYPLRSSLAPFSSTSITSLRADFEKRRVIGYNSASKFIIELGEQPKLYDYSTSGFRFTSRTLVAKDAEPIVVDRVGLVYQSNTSFTVEMDVKVNDSWKTESKFIIRPENDNGLAMLNLSNVYACRKFALRLTSLSSGTYISAILIHLKQGGIMGYSNK